MHEAILKEFLVGDSSTEELVKDLEGSMNTEGIITHHPIEDMEDEFTVKTLHLVKICDAVLDDILDPIQLRAIGFCLQASDKFYWDTDSKDGERVADIVFYWSTPEINYPLTKENVVLFRKHLTDGDSAFNKAT